MCLTLLLMLFMIRARNIKLRYELLKGIKNSHRNTGTCLACALLHIFGIRKLHKKRKYTYIGMPEHAPKTRAIKVEAKTGKFRREAT